jgi:hypothetical protein
MIDRLKSINEAAQREPIAITSYGRTSGYFVSAQEYAELQRLRALERRAYRLSELPAITGLLTGSSANPQHSQIFSMSGSRHVFSNRDLSGP